MLILRLQLGTALKTLTGRGTIFVHMVGLQWSPSSSHDVGGLPSSHSPRGGGGLGRRGVRTVRGDETSGTRQGRQAIGAEQKHMNSPIRNLVSPLLSNVRSRNQFPIVVQAPHEASGCNKGLCNSTPF